MVSRPSSSPSSPPACLACTVQQSGYAGGSDDAVLTGTPRSLCTQPVPPAVFSKVDTLAVFMAWFLPAPLWRVPGTRCRPRHGGLGGLGVSRHPLRGAPVRRQPDAAARAGPGLGRRARRDQVWADRAQGQLSAAVRATVPGGGDPRRGLPEPQRVDARHGHCRASGRRTRWGPARLDRGGRVARSSGSRGWGSSCSQDGRCGGVRRRTPRPVRASCSRTVAFSRTRATRRASVVTRGSRTLRPRSQATASVKIAFGPSPVVQARASTQAVSSPSASVKSRSP